MTIAELEYFLAVARFGSINRAAVSLFISQQALSRSIRSLEQSLGHELFFRTTSGMNLTPFGKVFLDKALPLVNEFHDLSAIGETIAAGTDGKIRVGIYEAGDFSYSIFLQNHYFQAEYPNIELSTCTMEQKKLISSLKEGEVDIAICMLTEQEMEKESSSVTFERLNETQLYLYLNKAHPASKKATADWHDLKDQGLAIMFTGDSVTASVHEHCRSAGFEPKTNFRTCRSELLFRYVNDGFGASVGTMSHPPKSCVNMVAIPFDPPVKLSHVVAYRNCSHLSDAAKNYISYLKIACAD